MAPAASSLGGDQLSGRGEKLAVFSKQAHLCICPLSPQKRLSVGVFLSEVLFGCRLPKLVTSDNMSINLQRILVTLLKQLSFGSTHEQKDTVC